MKAWIDHVEALARTHGVIVRRAVRRGSGRAKSYGGAKVIVTYGINTQRDYITALHEIAHQVQGQVEPKLEREASAWQWAIEQSIVEVSKPTRAHVALCLQSYVDDEHKYPTPRKGHVYWRLIRGG